MKKIGVFSLVILLSMFLILGVYAEENNTGLNGSENSNNTCDTSWEGYVYNPALEECELVGSSGCESPYEYFTKEECELAYGGNEIEDENETEEEIEDEVEDENETEGDGIGKAYGKKAKEDQTYTFVNENGETVEVEVKTQTRERDGETYQKILVKGVSIEDSNGTMIRVKLSNGNNQDIKVMPETASQTAIDKLRSKNITVVLKEVGVGNNLRVVYDVEANKTVRFLGMFKVKAQLGAIIDADTGEIVESDQPWWYFLAFGKNKEVEVPEPENNESESNETENNQTEIPECAGEGEQFSKVYAEEYPLTCCENLTEWGSGFDTRISINESCYETGMLIGAPIGTCLNLGDGICSEWENVCNSPEDCAGAQNSDYFSIEDFCNLSYDIYCSNETESLELELCDLC